MLKFIVEFWQDDTGDGYISPLLGVIFAMTASVVVFTALFIGLKNVAIKDSQAIQNITP